MRAALGLTKVDPETGHVHAARLRGLVTESVWREYFTFSFVRNPWDRLVSGFFFDKGNRQQALRDRTRDGFAAYAQRYIDARGAQQTDYLLDAAGEPLVDFIGRVESMALDWRTICGALDIDIPLPHENRSGHGHYSTYYDATTRGLVEERCAADIARFGYRFEAVDDT